MLTAIIVAAGSSRRVGFDKLFEIIAGKPVIAHAIAAFENSKSVSDIVVIAREDRHGEIKKLLCDQNWKKVRAIESGGEHRQDSVRAGLSRLGENVQDVAVHEAARTLGKPGLKERRLQKTRVHGVAALASASTS